MTSRPANLPLQHDSALQGVFPGYPSAGAQDLGAVPCRQAVACQHNGAVNCDDLARLDEPVQNGRSHKKPHSAWLALRLLAHPRSRSFEPVSALQGIAKSNQPS